MPEQGENVDPPVQLVAYDVSWPARFESERIIHHLHLVPVHSHLWTERLSFRDYLRRDRGAAAQYAELKQRLAEQHEFDREVYTDAKGPFVERILDLARAAARSDPD